VIIARHRSDLETAAEELQRSYGVSVTPIVLDLSVEGKPDELFSEMKKKSIHIDALVNNAGFGLFGEFSGTDLEKEVNMIHLNVIALTELTKLFLPSMLAMKSGKILNVSSIARFIPDHFQQCILRAKLMYSHFLNLLQKN
jgi:short-subunit dehydrogenase